MATKGVNVSGGRGVVAGNYGNVFQYFSSAPPPLATFIRSNEFSTVVDDRTREFVGRKAVFQQIDSLLAASEHPSGYIYVQGEPGIGKTAISAKLVLERGYLHHFNIAPAGITLGEQFLQNMCAQLIVRYQLPYDSLPSHAHRDGGFLAAVLKEASDAARERPLVVVVDAIDEAEKPEYGTPSNRLLLPRVLPPDVYIVLTGREEADPHLDVERISRILLREEAEDNLRDAGDYIARFILDNAAEMTTRLREMNADEASLAAALLDHSEGNFMYLTHVLRDIRSGKVVVQEKGMDSLPYGLQGYYRSHWRAMKAKDREIFEGVQRPVLCLLAVSQEAVSITQLAEWTRLDPPLVRSVIRDWREFLNENFDGTRRFRLYHKSFADFLDEEEDLRFYHNRIASAALAKIPGLD